MVGLTDLTISLANTTQSVTQTGDLIGLTLEGAHHHNLMDAPTLDSTGCIWATADGAGLHRDGNGHLGALEIGVCHNIGKSVRVGVAVGTSGVRQKQAFGGKNALNGTYVLGEADWAIPGTKIVASILGLYGRWDASLIRGYGTVGSIPSVGQTHVTGYSVRGRFDWQDAFSLGAIRFSPSISYTNTTSRMDAYQETGGNAPALFGAHSHTQQEVRTTLTAGYDLSQNTLLRFSLEHVHRFDGDSGSIVVANVLGVINVANSFAGVRTHQDWGRIGFDVDHRLSKNSLISISGHASSAGQDPDYSAAVSFKLLF